MDTITQAITQATATANYMIKQRDKAIATLKDLTEEIHDELYDLQTKYNRKCEELNRTKSQAVTYVSRIEELSNDRTLQDMELNKLRKYNDQLNYRLDRLAE